LQKTEYIRDLETAQMIAGIRAELAPLVAIAGYIPVPSLQSALQLGPRLQSYGQKAIQNLYKYTQPDGSNATAPTTRPSCLFSSFVNSKHLREDEIAQEAGNLIVAGSDTTAVSLTYLTWAVLHPRNTRVRERLLAEVNTLPQDAPFSEIAQLQYLRAVVDECLRLFCAAPGSLPRAVPEPGVTLGKYFIPAGTTVSTQAFTLHRDANIFADPEVFNPDRWLDASAEMRSAYVPFGAGSRTCIGMHLALLEMQLAAFVFLKRMPEARLASVQEADRDMEFENYFLIAPRGHKCEVTLV
jgi:cytochrome P450